MNYRLNILGTLELRDEAGSTINSVVQQQKRLAVLLYLALADADAMVARDTVLGIFWPDLPQETGRRNLTQALTWLRRSLGGDAILARGNEEIALNPAVVECDAARFQAAIRAGDTRAAAAMYAGDLLPGFFLADSTEFEQWLTASREALRRSAAEAFWTEAEAARQDGQLVTAAAHARRAAELASDNETATRRLMEFLESIGDRAGALDAFQALNRKLQAEFDSAPSRQTQELAEKIRTAGADTPVISDAAPVLRTVKSLPWRAPRGRSGTYAGAAILMFAFVSLWGLTRPGKTNTLGLDAAITIEEPKLYDGGTELVASNVVSDVTAALAEVPRITVRAEPFAANAQLRGTPFVLRPHLSVRDGELKVVASVLDVRDAAVIKSATFRAPADDEAAVADLAMNMSEFARETVGRRLQQLRALQHGDASALAINKGMLARLHADSLRSSGMKEVALLTLERADAALRQAIDNDRTSLLLIERAEVARERFWTLAFHLENAERAKAALLEGRQYADAALDMDEHNAAAHELRGLLAYHEWSGFPTGRPADTARDEALAELREAVRLNPWSARAWKYLSAIQISTGEYAEAYVAAESAYANDSYMEVSDGVTANLFVGALETGHRSAAEKWCRDMNRRDPSGGVSGAYCQLQLIAWSDQPDKESLERGENIIARVSESPVADLILPPMQAVLAVAYAKTGDDARARSLLAAVRSSGSEEAKPFVAWALTELGEKASARSVLREYVAGNPAGRAGLFNSARFASLKM